MLYPCFNFGQFHNSLIIEDKDTCAASHARALVAYKIIAAGLKENIVRLDKSTESKMLLE